ncbi:hypothetical protein B296_00027357 [Ensete ventricosum]|uniref:Uncharacterized protein n=1 Tax=Ensete ventricosum TaxID=4639 RepID=A0A427A2J5_ENSVE|nr:hypothetical protein B296_00027357 [Ensete ventricosum]
MIVPPRSTVVPSSPYFSGSFRRRLNFSDTAASAATPSPLLLPSASATSVAAPSSLLLPPASVASAAAPSLLLLHRRTAVPPLLPTTAAHLCLYRLLPPAPSAACSPTSPAIFFISLPSPASPPLPLLHLRTTPFFPPCSCHRLAPPQSLPPLLSTATTDRTPLLSHCRNPHQTIAALFLPPLLAAAFTAPFCLADPTFLQIQRCCCCSLQRRPATPGIHSRSPCWMPIASSRRSLLSSPQSPAVVVAIPHLLPSATIAFAAT